MKKIECQKDDGVSKQKRAQRFIKIALPSLSRKARFKRIFAVMI